MAEKLRFGDFAQKHIPLMGRKLKIADVFNEEIEVVGYRIGPSKYHATIPCLRLQLMFRDELCVLSTGSTVLIEQVETYKDKIPFIATIKQVGKFYTFT